LIHVVSIQIVPRSGDLFDQLIGGELVLKRFLFEVSREKGQHRNLKLYGEFSLDHDNFDLFEKEVYFLS
jgi:hypothetical protein